MSKVYVTQENPQFDYSGLESQGEVTFVTLKDFSSSPNSLYNADLMYNIDKAMAEYNPDEDFLAPSGSPLVTAVCVAKLAIKGVDRIHVLRWSNRDRAYQEVLIDLNNNGKVGA